IAMPVVVKKDGRRAEFDPAKLRASMALALRKRPVSVEQIDAAIERIQEKLLGIGGKEVLSAKVGEHVMRELKRIDKVAYVRFASVYRSFEDVDEFRRLIRDIYRRAFPPRGPARNPRRLPARGIAPARRDSYSASHGDEARSNASTTAGRARLLAPRSGRRRRD